MTATNWISKIMTQRWTEIPNWWLKKTGDFFQRLARHIKLIINTHLLLISCVECEKQTFSKPLMTVNKD